MRPGDSDGGYPDREGHPHESAGSGGGENGSAGALDPLSVLAGELEPQGSEGALLTLDPDLPPRHISRLPEPSDPEVSPKRLGLTLGILLLIALGVLLILRHASAKSGAIAAGSASFVPYVDVTLPPTYPFEEAADDPAHDVALGFVVAGASAPCTPSWGGYYTLQRAASSLDLERRIVQLRGEGGEAMVSFGGQRGSELALTCKSEPRLASAYGEVVQRYKLHTVDFDIEGAALSDAGASARRAQAIASLQRDKQIAGGHLAVWLTLPVTPSGLSPSATAVVEQMLARHVRLAGVNAMTMDFGAPGAPNEHVLASSERALEALDRQLPAIYRAAGLRLSSERAWGMIGATPMIGENDVSGEVFTLADARKLTAFAKKQHMARISMWSLNRDEQCNAASVEASGASNLCSGVEQRPLEFSHIFAKLHSSSTKSAVRPAEPIPGTVQATSGTPANSPYPIWKPTIGYPAGYKVVWDGDVYQARWYSEEQRPNIASVEGQETPWLLVGPVLPGEHMPRIPHPKPGTYQAWSARKVYRAGDHVLYRGLPYEAKWYSEGQSPPAEPEGSQSTPWKPLYKIPGEPSLQAN
ncbi:MAG TPA: hypothetical protein VGF95_00170 [Solirubrobacteraceae bacterium]|jgi:chitinase